jgi:hypothetical protein
MAQAVQLGGQQGQTQKSQKNTALQLPEHARILVPRRARGPFDRHGVVMVLCKNWGLDIYRLVIRIIFIYN